MIRINLLPKHNPPARTIGEAFPLLLIMFVGVVTVLAGWWWTALDAERLQLVEERQKKVSALQRIEEQLVAFDQLEQERDRLLSTHVATTEEDHGRPEATVRLLDAMSRDTADLDLWLVRLSIDGIDVHMEGEALTNESVRQLVDRLDRTAPVTALRSFAVTPMQDHNGARYRFVLHLLIG